MKQVDIVVVGGSAAGLTAAITARRHYPDRTTISNEGLGQQREEPTHPL